MSLTLEAESSGRPPKVGRRLVALGAASIALVLLLIYSLGSLSAPQATDSATTTTATSYAVAASSVLASAGAHAPDGYTQGPPHQLTPRESGLDSGGYAMFSTQGGATANMTILVFDSSQSAQTYIGSVIANAKGLSGYTDVTAVLSSFQRYGVCYGFGQVDPYGSGAVATGICTKGNVYIQVHGVSPSSLSSAKAEMSDLVGAAYQGAG